jgi:hypothetical protein
MDEESRVGLGGFGPDSRLRLDGWRSEFDLVVGRAMRQRRTGYAGGAQVPPEAHKSNNGRVCLKRI